MFGVKGRGAIVAYVEFYWLDTIGVSLEFYIIGACFI